MPTDAMKAAGRVYYDLINADAEDWKPSFVKAVAALLTTYAAAAVEEERERWRPFAKAELRRLMGDISERFYCAGWLIDLEYDLWTAIQTPDHPYPWGLGEIMPETLERLLWLHKAAGGWWTLDAFLATEEWLKDPKAIRSRQDTGKGEP